MAALEQSAPSKIDNPYVGPRTFRSEEAYLFFGREREAQDLTSLIIAKRLVLFYAQSGAGKSSLLNTRVVPGLTTEGFEVLPIGRVRGASALEVRAQNIYVYNLILSLHQHTWIPPDIETLSLPYFLDNLVFTDGKFSYNPQHEYAADEPLKPRVLLIDQFEEVLTTNPAAWQQRGDFFEQLVRALEVDDHLWIVLTMREDFVAAFEPFLHHLPGRLSDRYYMRRLSRDAALDAICKPADKAGRPFTIGAAKILVDNLRRIQLPEQEKATHLGEFVEPVQLQTVCFQMWESLKAQPGDRITEQNVHDYADVDRALAQFYEATISETVSQTGVSEIDLRDWFERDLITEAGTRGIVYRSDKVTGRLLTSVADFVNMRFMLRTEMRAGGTWYELVHDRFIQPIRVANGEWRLKHPLIQLAQEWKDADHGNDKLLTGTLLTSYLNTNWRALGLLVAEFMEASQEAQIRQEEALAKEREAAQQPEMLSAQVLTQEAEAWHQAEAARILDAEKLAKKQRQCAED